MAVKSQLWRFKLNNYDVIKKINNYTFRELITPGDRIKKVMKENGISGKKLAKDLNVTETTVTKWINNRVKIRTKNYEMLAEYFDVDIKYLMCEQVEPKESNEVTINEDEMKNLKQEWETYEDEMALNRVLASLGINIEVEKIEYIIPPIFDTEGNLKDNLPQNQLIEELDKITAYKYISKENGNSYVSRNIFIDIQNDEVTKNQYTVTVDNKSKTMSYEEYCVFINDIKKYIQFSAEKLLD